MSTLLIIVCVVLALFGILLFLIKPGAKRPLEDFSGLLIAHRGLYKNGSPAPENSLAAFRAAREAGYGVELDVQLTRDHQLIVFHDGSLKRVCGVDGFVRYWSYSELQTLNLLNTTEKIPLFTDVLEALDGVPLICEIKSDNGLKNEEICRMTYEQIKSYKGKYCVESFSPYLVEWFRKNQPQVIRGQLAGGGKNPNPRLAVAEFFPRHMLTNVLARPDFLAYKWTQSGTFGFWLCRKLYHPLLVGWTAKGREEIEEAQRIFPTVIFEQDD